MAVPERFANLPDYAFSRLRALLAGLEPGGSDKGGPPAILTIGEPRHPMPDFVGPILAGALDGFAKYPPNEGSADLLDAIAGWLHRRHGLDIAPGRIVSLNGTREGLFNAALALCPEGDSVLVPNPFYQVYAVGAAAIGARAIFVPATAATGDLPDFAALPAEVLDRAGIAFVCSPANPQGAVASAAWWEATIVLAERHDFLILADECYSEIWRAAPPVGALAVATRMGVPDRVVMFNSLSKRSNLPGLRSGFAAGGAAQIAQLRQLRSYAGAPVPLPLQAVSAAAWRDEAHVDASRALYQRKYALADAVLGDRPGWRGPEGGFFLWLRVPAAWGDGETAARALWTRAGLQVLPGAYLGRAADGGGNPGDPFIRVAMVDPPDVAAAALDRLAAALAEADAADAPHRKAR